jgi:hypothetical protein
MNLEYYEKKRQEIINKFTQGFIDKTYNYNPLTRKIIEALIRGDNPYNIIEMLILNQDNLINEFKTKLELSPMPTIKIEIEK